MLMGQKYKVHRSVIIDLVRQSCGVDLMGLATEAEIVEAIHTLDRIKADGLNTATGGRAKPDAGADGPRE
jgi:hypothetical protein